MNLVLFERPLFELAGRSITLLGLLAFIALFATGFILARFFQSGWVRQALTRLRLDENFVSILTMLLSGTVMALFAISAINAAGIPLSWTAPLPGLPLSLLQIFLLIGMLIGVIWLSGRTKRLLYDRILLRTGLNRSLQYAIAQITSFVVLFAGLFIVLENTGINLGALAVFAGAVGVGVGFGLQNVTSNFISGLVILTERPISIGDRVEVAGVAGQVRHIRARSTVVVTNDNISMIVPNSKFIEEPVTNWTYGDQRVRFRIPVGVAYGSDVETVKKALISAGTDHPATLKDPAPTIFFDGFGENALNFELVVWSSEMSHRPRRFRSDLNFAVEKNLRAAGIEIPFPQRDLRIRGGTLKIEHATPESLAQRDATLSR